MYSDRYGTGDFIQRMLGNQQLKCPHTSGILKNALLLCSGSLKSRSMVFCSDGCICKGESSGKLKSLNEGPATLVGTPQKSQDKCPTIRHTIRYSAQDSANLFGI